MKKILVTRHIGTEAMALMTDQADFEVRILVGGLAFALN